MSRNRNFKGSKNDKRGNRNLHDERASFDREANSEGIQDSRKARGFKSNGGGRDERLSPLNDFSWYSRNPRLLASVASISYPYKAGMLVPITTTPDVSGGKWTVPGVLSLSWAPTIGPSSLPTDPASIVGKELFAKVRETYSGRIQADAPDFVIYLMAIDSISAYISWLKRLYRTLNKYSPENYNYPDVVLAGMRISPAEIAKLKQNKMQLYQAIVELCAMTEKFVVPDIFPVLQRHKWMSENIYSDSPIMNSQTYLFNLTHVYKFGLSTGTAAAGMLKCVPIRSSSVLDVPYLYSFGKDLIDVLAASDDAYIISGYLMRAYEGTPKFTIDPPQMGETIDPVYVPEVLLQIENSTTISAFSNGDLDWNAVTQDPSTNALVCSMKPSASILQQVGSQTIAPSINVRSEVPTVIETVEATRLAAWVDPTSLIAYCATEVPLAWNMYRTGKTWTWSTDGTAMVGQFLGLTLSTTALTSQFVTAYTENMDRVLNISQWDWHPRIYFNVSPTTTPSGPIYIVGDTHNITTLSAETLQQIHRVCLFSEFNSFSSQY